MHPLWLIAAGVLVAIAANWIIPSGDTAFNVIILILSCLLILTRMIWTWVRVARLSRRPVAVLGLTAISCLGPLATGIAALFILILWAFWVIPNYTTAILLALAVSGMILFVTIMATILLARLVVKKNNQPGSSPVDKPAAT